MKHAINVSLYRVALDIMRNRRLLGYERGDILSQAPYVEYCRLRALGKA